jgi:hypothetical protein
VPALFADVPRHRVAHHAEPDPRYLGHAPLLPASLFRQF